MRVLKWTCLSLVVVIVVSVAIVGAQKSRYDSQLADLRNAVASRDQTIETQKGVFQKLSLESKDLSGLLDKSDEQVKLLQKELKDGKEQLLAATTIGLKWKKAYEASVKGHQTEVPSTEPGGTVRKRVDFENDFGYIGIVGHTLTDPPEAYVKIQQNRPLRVTVAVSQDKSGAWKTRATSSEENVGVDITLAGVDPWVLQPKWYEHVGVDLDLGVGSGVLGGLGVSYQIGKFQVGPKAWFTATDRVDKFFGVGLTWHPFQR